MKTLDVIKNELKKDYPSGIVNNLRMTNPTLYIKLRTYAKENNTSIKKVLEENDFIYLRNSIIKTYVEDYIALQKEFPNYKIESFYEVNNKLYYRTLSHAKSMQVSLKRYLNSLGFEYISREDITNETLEEELLKIYPNKKVKGLSSKNSKLYFRIYQIAKKENKTIGEYLNAFGFKYEDKQTKNTNTKDKEVKKTTKKKTSPKKETKSTTKKQEANKSQKKTTRKIKITTNSKETNNKPKRTYNKRKNTPITKEMEA